MNTIEKDDDTDIKLIAWATLSEFRTVEAQSIYLLLDPSLRTPGDQSVLGEWLATTDTIRIPIPHESFNDTNSPVLARFKPQIPEHVDFLWKVLEEARAEAAPLPQLEGRGRRICAFISSPSGIQHVARHLGAMTLHSRGDGHKYFLRYFDPAVWPFLWQELSSDQQATLLGPVSGWFCMDQGVWRTHVKLEPDKPGKNRLDLSHKQWMALADVGLINALDHALSLAAKPRPADFRQRARDAIHWARQCGFGRDIEIQACAEHLIRYGVAFREHPRIRELLQTAEPGTSYFALVGELSEADWEQIRTFSPAF